MSAPNKNFENEDFMTTFKNIFHQHPSQGGDKATP
jgi:hypothetical protein